MILTETEFFQYENLRAQFLEDIKLTGFTGQELLDLQVATTNFVQKIVAAKALPTPVVTPPTTVPTVPTNNTLDF